VTPDDCTDCPMPMSPPLLRRVALALMACGLTLAVPARAAAELVQFTSGAIVSVASYQTDGDTAVLTLRNGGELRLPKTSIAQVFDDEVCHPKAGAKPTEAVVTLPASAPLMWTRAALQAKVDKIADLVGVDRKLAHAVVVIESNYVPDAVSSKGAMGLMQLTSDVVKDYGVANPFDPEANLMAGLQYLRSLVVRLGVQNGLAAYNAGEGVVARYGGVPPYRETQDYVRHILALIRR
jgi:soluble lytic murein transglycosylase-like protein